MRKELLMLALLVLVVGCATTETPITPVQESPAPVAPKPTEPTTPATPSTNITGPILTGNCEKDCMSQCIEDSANACGFATDYDMCVSYCGTTIRPQGCKGACASGVPIECSIIFENECEKDCTRTCA